MMSGRRRFRYKCAILLLFFLLLGGFAAATQITAENVTIRISADGTAAVNASLHVRELTGRQFSYFVPYNVRDFRARSRAGSLSCDPNPRSAGSQLVCDAPRQTDLSVNVFYRTDALVNTQNDKTFQFSYTHNILTPVDQYRVRLLLPEGFGLLDKEHVTPAPEEIGSTGRAIFVRWHVRPRLGDTVQMQAPYENIGLSEQVGFPVIVFLLVVVIGVMGGVVYLFWRRRDQNDVMQVLQADEQEVVDVIREKGGTCEQREIVKTLNYSKAKISSVISDLADRNVVKKEKRGRINVITLSGEES